VADAWQLADAVNLRPEAFGGMAFHRERGVTLEVDEEAYRFLCGYLTPRPLPLPDHPAARLVPQLVRRDFLRPLKAGQEQALLPSRWQSPEPASTGQGHASLLPLGDGFTLSAPETVHLAITARCNLDCPGCYAPRPGVSPELTTAEVCGLIDQWARMRVFQLAVGGGEPLLYPGLFEMLAHARAQGIVPNLTTNGTLLTADAVRRLGRIGLARINVSWNGPDGVQRERSQIVARALRLLLDSTLSEGSCGQVGVNVLVTPTLIPRLPYVLARLHGLGVRHVTVLRPKPPAIPDDAAARAWYAANRLRRADLLHLRAILSA
jgi:hypothetical protein